MNEKVEEYKEKIISSSKIWISRNKVSHDFEKRSISKWKSDSIVLLGMRRLGKTEFLKYRISLLEDSKNDDLIDPVFGVGSTSKPNNSKALFIDLHAPIFASIDFATKDSKTFELFNNALIDILKSGEYKLVLIDEIQEREDWSTWLKGLVDWNQNITFVATGSDASSLKVESGLDRFKVLEVGGLSFREFAEMGNKIEPEMIDYLNDWLFPLTNQDSDKKELYDRVFQKQFEPKRFKGSNINGILEWIAVNPGSEVNFRSLTNRIINSLSLNINENGTGKMFNLLVSSKMIFILKNRAKELKRKGAKGERVFLTNPNVYKFFRNIDSFKDLDKNSVPRAGLVYENAVISSIRSTLHTPYEISQLGYYQDDNVDCDFVLFDEKYEIKSFDVFKNSEAIPSIIDKHKKLPGLIVLHDGKTTTYKGIEFINTKEFLMEERWIKA